MKEDHNFIASNGNGRKQLKLNQHEVSKILFAGERSVQWINNTWEIIISNSVYTGLTEVHPRPASTSDCRGCFDGSQWNLGSIALYVPAPIFYHGY